MVQRNLDADDLLRVTAARLKAFKASLPKRLGHRFHGRAHASRYTRDGAHIFVRLQVARDEDE